MRLRLANVRVLVADYRACFRFYRDVMGFDVVWGDEDGQYAEFKAGDGVVALYKRELMAEAVGTAGRPVDADCQDRTALIFEVEDVDAACEELRARGVELVTEPQDRPDWGVRTAHFRDPDGSLIEACRELTPPGTQG
jgi:lactoylglutathione lyase